MDRLLEVQEREIRLEFQLQTKCRTTIHLKNLLRTVYVAFKVLTTDPAGFSVKPPNGFIPPIGEYSFEVVMMPQTELPKAFPKSKITFLIKSAVAPGGPVGDRVPAEWFKSRKTHTFMDAKLRVVYTGPFLLGHMVAKGEMDSVKDLIHKQRSYNGTDDTGRTALHIAVTSGNVEMVHWLLRAGAAVDAVSTKSPKGQTALHLAASSNNVDVLKLLIENGANSEARDIEGQSALHFAVAGGHAECVKVLLQAGVDRFARSFDGKTALHRAAYNDHVQLIKLLVEWEG